MQNSNNGSITDPQLRQIDYLKLSFVSTAKVISAWPCSPLWPQFHLWLQLIVHQLGDYPHMSLEPSQREQPNVCEWNMIGHRPIVLWRFLLNHGKLYSPLVTHFHPQSQKVADELNKNAEHDSPCIEARRYIHTHTLYILLFSIAKVPSLKKIVHKFSRMRWLCSGMSLTKKKVIFLSKQAIPT